MAGLAVAARHGLEMKDAVKFADKCIKRELFSHFCTIKT